MSNTRNRHPARRRFLKQSAALTAQVAALAAPAVVIAKVAAGDPANQDTGAQSAKSAGLPPSPASAGDGPAARAKARL